MVAPAPATEEKAIGTVRVTASQLNVRKDASTSADVVTQVRRGTKLTLLADDRGWLKVRLASGEVGWVSAQHVARDGENAPRRKGCPPDSDFTFVKSPLPDLREQKAHGLVVVDAYVDVKGNVTSTKVISNSTGDLALGSLTEREIRTAKFAPPVRNCVPRAFIFTYKRSF